MSSKGKVLFQLYEIKIVELLVGLCMVWIIDVHHGLSWPAALGFRDPLQIFGLGTLVAVVMIGAQIALIRMFPHGWEVDQAWIDHFQKLPFYQVFILMGLTAAAEELLFRAGLQRIAIDLLGSAWLGIPVTAIIFAALHLRSHRSRLPLVAVFGIGLVFGWTYWWTGNLAVVIWGHFVYNVFVVLGKPRKTVNL